MVAGSNVDQTCTLDPRSANLRCNKCEYRYHEEKQLAAHNWYKHKAGANIRNHIADISVCPICKLNFRSRGRLIQHLMKCKGNPAKKHRSCQDLFMSSNLSPLAIASMLGAELLHAISKSVQSCHVSVPAR